ncbi:MAG: uroporphyrinogen-III C-methyltransferase [Chloroflexi bacterium]|nr:uroporphyrinogen-III C-methyltransferase [Chloroflexota bacterium]MCY3685023.1 uroporphyrinogen-III C-methyltransferase [Chloroflexota bacterium]MDE2707677.1 uroporphyrinogen-III C-methyltransferase [Chloroflexota bacterium]
MSDTQIELGLVYLVGAGPGDPGLITLTGAQALRDADVVLHDRLVAAELLKLAENADLVDVGKAPGGAAVPQQQINQMMIDHSRRGRRVVRLKGGDPFVFGRGGEEASALAAAGIPVQLVPGVSSAHAAAGALGIAVTDRRAASAVTVVTGSEGDGDAPPIDWGAVARVGGTIVVMMGWRNFDEIARRLIAAGMPADTPAAAIEQAWTPSQRSVFAPLNQLRARAADLQPPVTVVVGEVTTLATPEVQWNIIGRRVLVTRAATQAESLTQRLRTLNAHVVQLPTIEIRPMRDESVDAAVQRLVDGSYDIVAVTSVNGVGLLWDAMRQKGHDARALNNTCVAAIGSETAKALANRGVVADLVPETFTSAALADALTEWGVENRRILLARALQSSRVLRDQLRAAAANVDEIALYDIVTPNADVDALAEFKRGVDVVTLTSPSTARGLCDLAGKLVDLDSLHTVCIGPVTAEAARQLGFRVVATAETHTIDGLVQAVGRYLAGLGPPAAGIRKPE